jgi:hypothetical protein
LAPAAEAEAALVEKTEGRVFLAVQIDDPERSDKGSVEYLRGQFIIS